MTLGAAALLTGLLIFSAARERESDEIQDRDDPEILAAFCARIPADEPTEVQNARAAQPGRGRSADSPLAIPWLGWRDILWRTWAGITDDHLLTLAGGVAFFALLAMVPALTAGCLPTRCLPIRASFRISSTFSPTSFRRPRSTSYGTRSSASSQTTTAS